VHRSFLFLGFLIVSLPASAQTTTSDSAALQALLEEVRQLRQDLQTMSAAVLRAQILLHRLQAQETVTARSAQILDEARRRLSDMQAANKREASNIKNAEQFVNDTASPAGDRKQLEDWLPGAKVRLESAQVQEQELQARVIEAEELQRVEQAKLDGLQGQLDRLDKELEKLPQPRDSGPH